MKAVKFDCKKSVLKINNENYNKNGYKYINWLYDRYDVLEAMHDIFCDTPIMFVFRKPQEEFPSNFTILHSDLDWLRFGISVYISAKFELKCYSLYSVGEMQERQRADKSWDWLSSDQSQWRTESN